MPKDIKPESAVFIANQLKGTPGADGKVVPDPNVNIVDASGKLNNAAPAVDPVTGVTTAKIAPGTTPPGKQPESPAEKSASEKKKKDEEVEAKKKENLKKNDEADKKKKQDGEDAKKKAE